MTILLSACVEIPQQWKPKPLHPSDQLIVRPSRKVNSNNGATLVLIGHRLAHLQWPPSIGLLHWHLHQLMKMVSHSILYRISTASISVTTHHSCHSLSNLRLSWLPISQLNVQALCYSARPVLSLPHKITAAKRIRKKSVFLY